MTSDRSLIAKTAFEVMVIDEPARVTVMTDRGAGRFGYSSPAG